MGRAKPSSSVGVVPVRAEHVAPFLKTSLRSNGSTTPNSRDPQVAAKLHLIERLTELHEPFCHMLPRAVFLWILHFVARADEPVIFTIKTLQAQMRYDVTELTISPRAQVKIVFENTDDMPHNMVFFPTDTDVVAVSNKQLEKPDEALKRNWLPKIHGCGSIPNCSTQRARRNRLHRARETGIYPFVCTFPGHAVTMQGRLKVFAPGPKLSALKFQLYLGDWTRLPNFSTLTPHRTGEVPDNLVQLKLDDYKNQFGVVFTGRITAPKDGDYTFSLAGDDGVRITIDGKKIVEQDGVHPASDLREGKTRTESRRTRFPSRIFSSVRRSGNLRCVARPGLLDDAALEIGAPELARGHRHAQKR
jgi:azurin